VYVLFLKNCTRQLKVDAFAWYSVRIRVIFGVRFERQKVDKKKPSLHKNWNMQTLF